MSGLELIFTGSALLGTALLLLSSVGGGVRLRVHVPVRVPHPRVPFIKASRADDATATPMVLGFLAMFGIGGLFGAVAFGFGALGQTAVALAFGTSGAAIAFGMFAALRRAEGDQPTALRELVGRRARVVVTIDTASRGTVALTYDGAVQTLPATAPTRIPRGEEVVISGVRGLAVTVRGIQPP
jgi:membrane protein implicated in regulation of membrane protease activity